MNIRKATIKDKDAILNLLVELKRSAYAEMGESVQDIFVSEVSHTLFEKVHGREDAHIFVAEESGKIVGVCVAFEVPKIPEGKNRLIVEELVILPEHRGKGVGSLLLAHIESLANKRSISMVKINTGTKLKANEFYKKHGYLHFENAYRKKL